jgi:fatty-acyl-CoA synthase
MQVRLETRCTSTNFIQRRNFNSKYSHTQIRWKSTNVKVPLPKVPLQHAHPNHKVNHSPLDPTQFLSRASRLFPNRVAVEYGDRKTTYKDMEYRVRQGATRLKQLGIQRGDRVATLLPNIPMGFELNFAVAKAGAVLVTVNARLQMTEIEYILEHSGSKILFVDSELLHKGELEKVADKLGIQLIVSNDSGGPEDGYEQFLQSVKEPLSWRELVGPESEEDTFSVNYTSGTSGRPKGVETSYRGTYLMAVNNIIVQNITKDSRMIMIVPLFHCNGWCYPWSLTGVGATAIAIRKVDYDDIWFHLKQGATHYNAAPTVQSFIVNNPNAVRLPQRVYTGTGGSAPSARLLGEMMHLNINPITHVYGLTETYGPLVTHTFDPLDSPELLIDEVALQLSRQGQNILCADDVTIVDEEMNEMPWDGVSSGEIVMRGNLVMKGYWNNPEATRDAFRGGWFHSGDLAVRHPSGELEIVDRMKDVIVSGGENIGSVEIEKVLAKHPFVLECAVVATKDDTWGERPLAYVHVKPEILEHGGYGPGDLERALADHCRSHLAGFKVPSRIQLEIEPLPKTASGKIKKHGE